MRKAALMIGLAVLIFAMAAQAFAQEVRFPVMSAEELKADIDAGKKLYIVDVRTKQEYDQGHLPGAANIPPEAFQYIPGLLPMNKDYPVIFYCRGWG